MKRDMDLIRAILLRLEESENAHNGTKVLSDLADDRAVSAHLKMLEDAGFLENYEVRPFAGKMLTLRHGWRITWQGHEFIDTVRDPEIWRKTKSGAEKVGSWSMKLLTDIATGFVRAKAQEIGLPV